mmetsp:Transcript_10890/g.67293  ORF Transcript_10890/g.67293 Transcript_10890/m.67293 type:complete len:87 (+) Transcript_10890:2268-2528(+)
MFTTNDLHHLSLVRGAQTSKGTWLTMQAITNSKQCKENTSMSVLKRQDLSCKSTSCLVIQSAGVHEKHKAVRVRRLADLKYAQCSV